MKRSPADRYRELLKQEFDRRCKKNSRYSLRAMARDSGLSSARLSEILSGKQGMSRQSASRVAQALAFSTEQAELFVGLVEWAHSRSPHRREVAQLKVKALDQSGQAVHLSTDVFEAISQWYHFAILELTRLEGFQSEVPWIADRLDVPEQEVSSAIDRLIRLGLLAYEEGRWTCLKASTISPSDVPSEAIKNSHLNVLEKAKQALRGQPVEVRDFSTLIFSMDRRGFSEVRDGLRQYRRRLADSVDRPGKRDAIYCLAMQFFEVTQPLKGKRT